MKHFLRTRHVPRLVVVLAFYYILVVSLSSSTVAAAGGAAAGGAAANTSASALPSTSPSPITSPPTESTTNTTIETGDIIDGYPVISRLDTSSLKDGFHKFWFHATENGAGGYYHIPILVKKNGTGPIVMIQSSIHGDEVAGAQVIFELFADIKTTEMSGTLVAIQGMNSMGLLLHTRKFYQVEVGGTYEDLNRLMPGNEDGNTASRYCHYLWNNLYMPSKPNFFFDLHSTGTGAKLPFFVYADRRMERVDEVVLLSPADIIKDDIGINGTVEQEMIRVGIPSVTYELGTAREWNKVIAIHGVQGIKNTMHHLGILEQYHFDMMNVETFFCNTMEKIVAKRGGYMETIVYLKDDVDKGSIVGFLYDAFGDVRETYIAPVSGRVTYLATDPIREPGSTIMKLCYQKDHSHHYDHETEDRSSKNNSTVDPV